MPWCLLLYPPRDRYCVATILFSNPRYQPSHPIPHLLGPTTSGRANGDQQTDYRAPLGIPAWRPKELALLWKTHQPDGTFSTRLRSEELFHSPESRRSDLHNPRYGPGKMADWLCPAKVQPRYQIRGREFWTGEVHEAKPMHAELGSR
jgi:hypothetical protein